MNKLRLYNSLTRKKEEFYTIVEGKVSMYVCGPTVYDFLHVGNARPIIVFDTLRKYLEYIGYEVDYVQNFTDIDDKIIARGDVAEKFLNEALHDMNSLLVTPSKNPRVTEEIPEIISMIDILIKKGHAYEAGGDVYFHVPSYKGYGKLKKQEESMTRLETNSLKKNEKDFALWKKSKEGEPYFESPWGRGRPGWHIECSAMAKKYLGSTIDIHAGGIDLLFPHHENEIAQSCCANEADFANFFMHNNFVNIDEEKMSKSLGNFLTIREVAEKYGYYTLRFFILSTHYRTAMNFSDEALSAAKKGLSRINNCIVDNEKSIKEADLTSFETRFYEALNDDFNTANAISVLFELVSEINKDNLNPNLLKSLYLILGFNVVYISEDNIEITAKINERNKAKKNKNFALADEIRNELLEKGIILEDTREGTRWKYES